MTIHHKSMKLVALVALTAILSIWYAGPAAAADRYRRNGGKKRRVRIKNSRRQHLSIRAN